MTTVVINGKEIETAVSATDYNNWKDRKFDIEDNGDQLVNFGDSVKSKDTSHVVKDAIFGSKLKKDLGRYLVATSSFFLPSAQNSSSVSPASRYSALIQRLPVEIRNLFAQKGTVVNVEADMVSSVGKDRKSTGDRIFEYNTPMISIGGMFSDVEVQIQQRGELIFISGRNIPLPAGATLNSGSIYIKGNQVYAGNSAVINGTECDVVNLYFDGEEHKDKPYISFGKNQTVFSSSSTSRNITTTVGKDRVTIAIRDSVCIVKDGKITITMNSSKSGAIFRSRLKNMQKIKFG